MSYLVLYAARRPTTIGRARRGARVDERTLLNLPGFDGGAHVRVFVENTSGRSRRIRRTPPVPRIRLRIADCANEIALEFSVESPELRENSLHKIETLLGALRRFRDGLEAEAELYATRERRS
jgi:hypothetical protein